MSVADRLTSLGIDLPKPAAPVANYVPFVISGNIISISGQIPMGPDGLAFQGKVGQEVSIDDAIRAAHLCALNLIAQMNAAVDGDLERISRVIKLGGFVNCVDGFGDQPKVINAASDLMVDVFGDKGRHSRSAVGTNALPMNVPVEIDALVEIS
ncbi:RidA family protein [Kordiimonas sp. SCSIO 12610]|uniref:RidA family protein n=1 Tax=Kordiimonas sp. SCSIO 12610 TaxID=2829597 RepID=UPI002108F97D|nr:RidA family protein [Kordiimonas sp. SCSIO 12610]UTW54268.1 RidA family protein [Kordiimonas sp. SCSIO 12610]